jgi:hypothetical protein
MVTSSFYRLRHRIPEYGSDQPRRACEGRSVKRLRQNGSSNWFCDATSVLRQALCDNDVRAFGMNETPLFPLDISGAMDKAIAHSGELFLILEGIESEKKVTA